MDICAICTNELVSNGISTLLCGHSFHKICISNWFEVKRTCPYCRKFQPKINFCTISDGMKNDAVEFAIKSMEYFPENINFPILSTAREIEECMKNKYGKYWTCIVYTGTFQPDAHHFKYEIEFECKKNVHVLLCKA